MTYPIAHRGIPSKGGENSLSAFKAALSHVTVVETDIRVTSDNVPVCVHDSSLGRTHNDGMRVGHATLKELQDAAPDIPCLDDVLDLVAGSNGALILDVKVNQPNAIEQILECVQRSRMQWNNGSQLRKGEPLDESTAVFQSADAVLLQSVRSRTGAGTIELIRGHSSIREVMLTAPFISSYAQGVTLPESITTRNLVRTLHSMRVGVYVYTVNDEDRYAAVARTKADAIFTDHVDLLA